MKGLAFVNGTYVKWIRRKKLRKILLKVRAPTFLEFTRKIVVCGGSHILGINL